MESSRSDDRHSLSPCRVPPAATLHPSKGTNKTLLHAKQYSDAETKRVGRQKPKLIRIWRVPISVPARPESY